MTLCQMAYPQTQWFKFHQQYSGGQPCLKHHQKPSVISSQHQGFVSPDSPAPRMNSSISLQRSASDVAPLPENIMLTAMYEIHRGSAARAAASDDSDTNLLYMHQEDLARTRKEASRRRRTQAEQRRRDKLCDAYKKLQNLLRVSSKSSKMLLLHTATNHISAIEAENQVLYHRIVALEQQIQRLNLVAES
ncbi:hypothetical protein MVEN_00032900 [Mycena venus]|uniref:BHLH domain-containing protein n=1 Tax=Mycena venus TaxID=2733690 RepID=A0A8H6Z370_9AGAR|nr:hypothetical protein MVEN_00032900 [Mycena venus]